MLGWCSDSHGEYAQNSRYIYRWSCDEVMSEGEGIEVCRTVGKLIVKIRTQSEFGIMIKGFIIISVFLFPQSENKKNKELH